MIAHIACANSTVAISIETRKRLLAEQLQLATKDVIMAAIYTVIDSDRHDEF